MPSPLPIKLGPHIKPWVYIIYWHEWHVHWLKWMWLWWWCQFPYVVVPCHHRPSSMSSFLSSFLVIIPSACPACLQNTAPLLLFLTTWAWCHFSNIIVPWFVPLACPAHLLEIRILRRLLAVYGAATVFLTTYLNHDVTSSMSSSLDVFPPACPARLPLRCLLAEYGAVAVFQTTDNHSWYIHSVTLCTVQAPTQTMKKTWKNHVWTWWLFTLSITCRLFSFQSFHSLRPSTYCHANTDSYVF